MRTHSGTATGAAAIVGIALILTTTALMFAVVVAPRDIGGCTSDPARSVIPASATRVGGLSATQLANAGSVIAEGRRRQVPTQAVVIALAVASQESHFTNYANDGRGSDLDFFQAGIQRSLALPHEAVGTDHGSLGIFQQQWPWWGTMADLMNPARAAGKFYAALLEVPRWPTMPVTVAAQAVQRSAFPDAYADDEALARQLLGRPATGAAVETVSATTTASSCLAGTDPGTVVFPLPRGVSYVDNRNWGGQGVHWARFHTGTDLSAVCGTPVLAATGGHVVIRTDQAWAGRWLVEVSTGIGQLTTWYAHMRSVTITNGEAVAAGQQIGQVGDLGNATGCHLHFEVHPKGGSIYQDSVNPSTWLAKNVGRNAATVAPAF